MLTSIEAKLTAYRKRDYFTIVEGKISDMEGIEWVNKHPKQYNQEELCDIQLEIMKKETQD